MRFTRARAWGPIGLFVVIAACAGGEEGLAPIDAADFCTDDDQCPAGQVCSGGVCRIPTDAGPPADAPLAPAEIVVDPTALSFGNALLGVDTTFPVEIANIGEQPLHVTNITVFENDSLAEYSTSPTGAVNLTIAGGDSVQIAVTLRPEDAEQDVAEIYIDSDDADEPRVTVTAVSELKGTPDLTVAPDTVDYGTVSWGTTNVRDVDVANTGTGNTPLVVDGVSVTNTSGMGTLFTADLYQVLPGGTEVPVTAPVYLSAGDAVTPADLLRVRVTFVATTASSGPVPDEDLVIVTNDPDAAEAQKLVPIVGTVIGCEIPVAEICDGLDNDCDLVADEGDPGSGAPCTTGDPGICSPGVEHCVSGGIECVANSAPQMESCNNIDDDCDGLTDDGLVQTCYNACGAAGVEFCSGGAWVGCNAPPVPSEICDGVDNDCDGVTDEGDPGGGAACTTGLPGVCSGGTLHCVGGGISCVQNTLSSAEICDTLDNDCDGMADEGNPGGGAVCSTGQPGVCNAGHLQCLAGSVQCLRDTDPSTETCDYLDNDCNGVIDNGFNTSTDVTNCGTCGTVCNVPDAVETCVSGSCQIASCASTYLDVNGTYWDGCECQDDATEVGSSGDACSGTVTVGTVVEGGSMTLSGKIATAGDEDWYEVTFEDAADPGGGSCDPFRPNITFSSNPGGAYRFQIWTTSCTASGCGSGDLTEYFYYSGPAGDHCCWSSVDSWDWPTLCGNQSHAVRIRVRKASGGPTCDTYSLLVKNGP